MSLYPNRDEVPKRLGRYELIGHLATGGMAEIHLARLAGEGGFEKVVVVKRLLPELVASPAYVAMFLDEGKLVARLDHPNICEVHELGRDGAEYYLAMPYLDGIAVHELIARPRDPDRMAQLRVAAGVIVQACAGLHHAHELVDADGAPAGLVHRDVSPSNLFVTSAGTVKVLDFGVAKVRGATETEVGTIKGKQQYMAPEQLLGEPLDRRCDVFALGIVLFELATHSRLFKRGSDYLTAKAVLEEPIPRADAIDPAVPKALADVIEKALARAPRDRYATATELAKAIEGAIEVGTPREIAAAIVNTDELSAMRTRQAKVIAHAKEIEIPSVTTAAYRVPTGPATEVTRKREATEPATEVTPRRAEPATESNPRRPESEPATELMPNRRAELGTELMQRRPAEPTELMQRRPAEPTELMQRRPAEPTELMQRRPAEPTELMTRRQVPWFPIAVATVILGAGAVVLVSRLVPDAAPVVARDAAPVVARDAAPAVAIATPDAAPVVELDAAPVVAIDADNEIEMPPIDVERPPPDRPKAPGMFSIDSSPWATIYVDGNSLGITPIVKRSLPAGRHKLRAVLKDGRSKEMSIDIPAGKLAKPIQLTW